jgi:multiple sugar transport system substrate-binding protein
MVASFIVAQHYKREWSLMKKSVLGIVLVSVLIFTLCTAGGLAAPAVTITYWDFISYGGDDPRGKAMAENIASFESKNPGIKVKVETVPYPQISSRLIQATATKKTPDVIRIQDMFLSLNVAAGTLAPLDAYARGHNWNDSLIPKKAVVFNKKIVAIPHDVRCPVLEYRADLLQKKGLKVPQTWDELGKTGALLSENGVSGFEMGLSRADLASNLIETFTAMLWDAGGEVFDKNGRAAFNSKAGVKVVQTLYDLMFKYKAMSKESLGDTYNSIHQGLQSGTIAMGTLGTHRVNTVRIQGGLGDRLQTAPLPGFSRNKPATTLMFYFTLAMGSYPTDKEAAWKFIDFMTSREAELRRAKAGELPIRLSTYNDPSCQGKEILMWKDYMAKHGRTFRYPEQWEQFSVMFADTMQKIMLKQSQIKPALDALAKEYNALAAQSGK